MSVVGSDQVLPLFLYISGAAVNYANKTAFQAAGWGLTWQDADGADLPTQPTWTLPIAGDATTGRHIVKFAEPDGTYTIKITQATNGSSYPLEATGEGSSYDIDAIGALIATSGGSVISTSAVTDTATMFDGDSIYLTFSVLEAALTQIGASSLADCDTLAAEIKLDANDSGDSADVATLTESIVSDVSGTRTVRGTLDAFPSALAVEDSQKSRQATAHLRLTKGTKTIIASEIKLTINWKATT